MGAGIIRTGLQRIGLEVLRVLSEDGDVFVVKAGPKFQLISRNHMGEPCFATPAISKSVIYFRITETLVAVG